MDVKTHYVGQGALAVVRHNYEAIIIDAHLPSSDLDLLDHIREDLYYSLNNCRVMGLVLTGFDADHCSPDGVELILSRHRPHWVMYPRYHKDTDTVAEVFRIIERHERSRQFTAYPLRRHAVRVDTVSSRYLTGLTRKFDLELFSPHFEDMDDSNNSSIVLRIKGHDDYSFSYLVTGDTENSRWERINQIFGDRLRSDVLAAPHHGSEDAAHPGALRSINPNTVLISAGYDNQYGHPHPQALRIYRSVAKQVYATNLRDAGSHSRSVGSLFTTTNWEGFKTVKHR